MPAIQRIAGTGHSAEFLALSKDTVAAGEFKFYELISDNGNTSVAFVKTVGERAI